MVFWIVWVNEDGFTSEFWWICGRHIKHGNLENGRFGNCSDYLSGFGVYNSSIYYSDVAVYGFQQTLGDD